MLNRHEIIGNVGADPSFRVTGGGMSVCDIRVATTEKWTDKSGQKKEETEWHNVTAWDRTAEVIRDYVRKGSKVYVAGKSKTRKWQDKDGNDRYTTEIVVDKLVLLDSRQDAQRPAAGGHTYQDDPGDHLPSFDVPSRGNSDPFGGPL